MTVVLPFPISVRQSNSVCLSVRLFSPSLLSHSISSHSLACSAGFSENDLTWDNSDWGTWENPEANEAGPPVSFRLISFLP